MKSRLAGGSTTRSVRELITWNFASREVGMVRSSEEIPVMGMERRGQAIRRAEIR